MALSFEENERWRPCRYRDEEDFRIGDLPIRVAVFEEKSDEVEPVDEFGERDWTDPCACLNRILSAPISATAPLLQNHQRASRPASDVHPLHTSAFPPPRKRWVMVALNPGYGAADRRR